EGQKEISLEDIMRVHHWPIFMDEKTSADLIRPHLSEKGATPLQGEELRSKYWIVADPSMPVEARVVASFRACCTSSETLSLKSASNTYFAMAQNPLYAQSVLPAPPAPRAEAGFNDLTAEVPPNQPFYMEVGGIYNTTFETYRGIITFPLRGNNGQRVPHSYVVVHDYSMPYNLGCAQQGENGYGNCDFQDNVFLVSNIMPYDAPNPERLISRDLTLTWDRAYEGTLPDGAGVSTGFTSTQQNSLDLWQSSNSFRSDLIAVGTGSLTLTSPADSRIKTVDGTQSTLINGLQVDFDGTVPFAVEAVVTGFGTGLQTGTGAVGIFMGPDRFFNLRVVARANGAEMVLTNSYGGAEGAAATAAGFTIGTASKIAFRLEGDPSTNTMNAFVAADGGDWKQVGTTLVATGDTVARLFAHINRAGIIVSSEGPVAFSATFLAFAVLPRCADPAAATPLLVDAVTPPIFTLQPGSPTPTGTTKPGDTTIQATTTAAATNPGDTISTTKPGQTLPGDATTRPGITAPSGTAVPTTRPSQQGSPASLTSVSVVLVAALIALALACF
nr:hypothetical protein [Gemmatimonadales bacterium]